MNLFSHRCEWKSCCTIMSIFILSTYDIWNLHARDLFAIFGMASNLVNAKSNSHPCSQTPACQLQSFALSYSSLLLTVFQWLVHALFFCPHCLLFPQPGFRVRRYLGFVLLYILFPSSVVILWWWSYPCNSCDTDETFFSFFVTLECLICWLSREPQT